MSKILFDTFTYRWRKQGNSYYFGRNLNNDLPEFEELEKQYYLNQLITSLLIHEKLSIKLDSLEELELLIGIDNVLRLFNDDCLEIIDDGGTMEGFLIGGNGENIFMNFNSCTGLQIDAIEERLRKKYRGRFEDKKVGPANPVAKEVPFKIQENKDLSKSGNPRTPDEGSKTEPKVEETWPLPVENPKGVKDLLAICGVKK